MGASDGKKSFSPPALSPCLMFKLAQVLEKSYVHSTILPSELSQDSRIMNLEILLHIN